MALFTQSYTNLDRIPDIPNDLPSAGISKSKSFVADYILATPAFNHVTAYTAQDFFSSSSYGEDYIYNRVWVSPAFIEHGILSATKETDGLIWNTNTFSVTLTSIVESGTEGLFLTVDSLPSVINTYRELPFTINTTLTGPAVIDATYTFTIDGINHPINITGQRSIPFTIRPQIPVSESWQWLTKILTSYDTSEQRIMLRDTPRRKLSHSYKAYTAYESAILTNILIGGIGNYFSVPSWHEQKSLIANITTGETEVFVDTRFADFQIGWKAMLWSDSASFEIIDIDTINEGSIILGTPVKGSFSAGSLVLPVHFGVVKDSMQSKVSTVSLREAKVDFLFEDTTVPDISTYNPAVTYQGYEVLQQLSYCFSDNSASQDISRPMTFFDNGQGKFEIENKNHATLSNTLGFFSQELSEIWDVKTFLASIKGRLKPFWALTWTKDIEIVGAYSSIETELTILPIFYSLFFSGETHRSDIAFIKKDGTIQYRRIIDSSDTTIDIDSPLGFEFSMSDFSMICFLHLVRSTSDDVNFEWVQAGQVQISLPVVGIDE